MTVWLFQKTELGKMFWIDKSKCYNDGLLNNSQLFKLFGHFSDEDAESVQSDIIERLESGSNKTVGVELFAICETTFKEWAVSACSSYYYGDELLLYVLCRVFHRHALIVCYDKIWTILDPQDKQLMEMELLDACDVHLIFLRPGIFAELVLKKKHFVATRSAQKESPLEFPNWTTGTQEKSADLLDKLADSTPLKLYEDNIKSETVEQQCSETGETPVISSLQNDLVEVSPTEDKVNKVPTSSTPSTDSLNAITDEEDTSVKVRNSQNNQDTSLASSDKNDDFSYESLLELPANPSSLKAQCIQRIMEQAVNHHPLTLLMICLDSLSWNENKRHPCCMQLPHTLVMQTQVAELVNYSAPVERLNISRNEEVLLYGNIRVNRKVRDCWLANLNKRSSCGKTSKIDRG